jgi:hypothetical protein
MGKEEVGFEMDVSCLLVADVLDVGMTEKQWFVFVFKFLNEKP